MKINFSEKCIFALNQQVNYIASNKPIAARNFKNNILKFLKKDLKNLYHFKKSIYYEHETIRDHVLKGTLPFIK